MVNRHQALKEYKQNNERILALPPTKPEEIFFDERARLIKRNVFLMHTYKIGICANCHLQCDLANVMTETHYGLKYYITHPKDSFRLIKKLLKKEIKYLF